MSEHSLDKVDAISVNSNGTLSYEEFKQAIENQNNEKRTLSDKVSDGYAKIPSALRQLTNFDPTGISSYFDGILSEHKAMREQDNMIRALYGAYQAIFRFGTIIKEHVENHEDNFSSLSDSYFEKSKSCHQKQKIEIFRNIWFNGIINTEREFDEKEFIFELVESLTYEQIITLKYIYYTVENRRKVTEIIDNDESTICVSVDEISKEHKMSGIYVQQLCANLVGRGLLRSARKTEITTQPTQLMPTDYLSILTEYIKEPAV